MADNVWIDVLTEKIRKQIKLLIADHDCDIVFPFSKCLLEFFHTALDISKYDVSVLTEENIGKHNHPLYFVDEHKNTHEVLNKYHFNLEQSFSSLGQLIKETLQDTWDHETIELEDLSYMNDIDADSEIYFIVLSKEKGDIKVGDDEKGNDVIPAKTVVSVSEKEKNEDSSGEKIDNNLNKDQKTGGSDDSNHNGNKNKLSVYFLCVPIYSRQYITKPNFSSHMERVKIGFRNKTYLPKLQENMHMSFSMISAMSNGFNVVLYSQTHKYMPKILHQSQGVRLILSNGMDVIFNGHLAHVWWKIKDK